MARKSRLPRQRRMLDSTIRERERQQYQREAVWAAEHVHHQRVECARRWARAFLRLLLWSFFIAFFVGAIGAARSAEYESVEPTPHLIEQYRQPNLRDKGGRLIEASTANSCCGKADAYWADEFERDKDGHLVAIVTDPRDDAEVYRGDAKAGSARVNVPIGTRVLIPDEKIITFEEQPKNTTGHGWVWLYIYQDEESGKTTGMSVICYLIPEAG